MNECISNKISIFKIHMLCPVSFSITSMIVSACFKPATVAMPIY